MNHQFDELTKSLAQSVTRRAALKQFGLGLAGMALACFGLGKRAMLPLITVALRTLADAQGGMPLWTNLYSPPADRTYARAVAVDGNGNVFVAGTAPTTTGGSVDYVIIKYSNSGLPFWTNRFNGPGNNEDWLTAMAVDHSGNVIVTGYTSPGGKWHYGTVKYSNAGVPLWTNLYSGPFNNDYAYALAVDGSGNVIVTGAVDKGDSSSDFAT